MAEFGFTEKLIKLTRAHVQKDKSTSTLQGTKIQRSNISTVVQLDGSYITFK